LKLRPEDVTQEMLDGTQLLPGQLVSVSANFRRDPSSGEIVDAAGRRRPAQYIDASVDIYDDRQRHWYIAPLKKLLDGEAQVDEDYIIVAMGCAYFEGVEYLHKGHDKGGNGKAFKRCAARVLGLAANSAELKQLWESVRCGLFHTGFAGPKVRVRSGMATAVGFGSDRFLYVDPSKLIGAIERHHADYMASLRDPSNTTLRENFRKRFAEIAGWK